MFVRPEYPFEEKDEEEVIEDEDEAELKLDRIDEEHRGFGDGVSDDEDAEPFLDLGAKSASSAQVFVVVFVS